jgi:hypothetical protein
VLSHHSGISFSVANKNKLDIVPVTRMHPGTTIIFHAGFALVLVAATNFTSNSSKLVVLAHDGVHSLHLDVATTFWVV